MEYFINNIAEILLLIFMVITFLQSGIDKILDWNGNLSWLKGHFEKTPFKNTVPLLLAFVLLFEMAAGICCAIGVYQFVAVGKSSLALYGAILSCISLLMLLLGQRIAKDYAGAMTIVIYFIPAIFLVFLLQE